jgi:FtsH-binding integral membrane protein
MQAEIEAEIARLEADAWSRKKKILWTVLSFLALVGLVFFAASFQKSPSPVLAPFLGFLVLLSASMVIITLFALASISISTRVQKDALQKGWKTPGEPGYHLPAKK